MSEYALIAEPDEALAETLSRLVRDDGFEAVVVRDGADARAVLQERGAPALLITDLTLPRVDGFRVVGALRELVSRSKCPAIIVSGSMQLRTEAYRRRDELGIVELMATRMSLASMRSAIRRALATATGVSLPPPPPPKQLPSRPPSRSQPPATRRPSSLPPSGEIHLDPQRVARISDTGITAITSVDGHLQALVEEVALRLNVSMAFLSVVLPDRQWCKAHVGLPLALRADAGSELVTTFCRVVVDTDDRAPLVVPDTRVHSVFANAPLVREGRVGGYAGAPIVTADGDIVGTLSVASELPLELGSEAVDTLVAYARRASGELTLAADERHERERELEIGSFLPRGEEGRDDATVARFLAATFEALECGVLVLDAGPRVVYANRFFAELVRARREDILGVDRDTLLDRLLAGQPDAEALRRRLAVAPGGPYVAREDFHFTVPLRRSLRWMTRPVVLPSGLGQLTIVDDVSADYELVHERERSAQYDTLTGLQNRRALLELIGREVARASRHKLRLSFIHFDVDQFAAFNQRRGHAAGDDALRAMARELSASVRACDALGRWGGEEFLAVLPGASAAEALEVAGRALAAVWALELGGSTPLTLSAGIAEIAVGEKAADALARAEAALASAKADGPNSIR